MLNQADTEFSLMLSPPRPFSEGSGKRPGVHHLEPNGSDLALLVQGPGDAADVYRLSHAFGAGFVGHNSLIEEDSVGSHITPTPCRMSGKSLLLPDSGRGSLQSAVLSHRWSHSPGRSPPFLMSPSALRGIEQILPGFTRQPIF